MTDCRSTDENEPLRVDATTASMSLARWQGFFLPRADIIELPSVLNKVIGRPSLAADARHPAIHSLSEHAPHDSGLASERPSLW